MSTLGMMMTAGMVAGSGAALIVVGAHRSQPRLADALAQLDGQQPAPTADIPDSKLERAAGWIHHTLRLPVSKTQHQILLMSDRSVADFFAEKLVLVTLGLLAPALWVVLQLIAFGTASTAPLAVSPILAIGGYFLADYRLAHSATRVRKATSQAVHTFFDLVALERLANASGTQAVTTASAISAAPLFRRISLGLERCRLEQTTPWRELRDIAQEWDIPELADLADVMRLEEQGAALAETLQARVRELREAHLTAERTRAQNDTEALTIWMTLPALLLGLAFIIPPLLMLTLM